MISTLVYSAHSFGRCGGSGSSSSSTGPTTQRQPSSGGHAVQEPNIDFELDVVVYFNSGKCVFHTREVSKDEDGNSSSSSGPRRMVKERSFTGNLLDAAAATGSAGATLNGGISSPKNSHPRYHQRSSSGSLQKMMTTSTGGLKVNVSSSRLMRHSGLSTSQHQTECTVFLIPGLDIKVHYNSKNVTLDSSPDKNQPAAAGGTSFGPSPVHFSSPPYGSNSRQGMSKDLEFHGSSSSSQNVQLSSSSRQQKSGQTKKAACFAWMTLKSIPEETVITPHILDFLEQALEPIPIETPKLNSPTAGGNNSADDMLASAPAQYAVIYGSFPVDVIVYLHVQPSVLRFSCLPVSRVECLLQLPSVDLVFSSKRAEDELLDPFSSSLLSSNSIQTPIVTGFSKKAVPGKAVFSSKYSHGASGHRRAGSDFRHGTCASSAGSNHNNSQQQVESSVGGLSMTGCLADFSLYIFHPYGGQKKTTVNMPSSLNTDSSSSSMGHSTASKLLTSRKDSLSLQVEFVKVNISRSRKLIFTLESTSPRFVMSHGAPDRNYQSAMIRFSALCDIGSASFKYDMRRLTEILAFPKAWYRKAIWKRMFLGDESIRSTLFSDTDDDDDDENGGDKPVHDSPESSCDDLLDGLKKSPEREALWLNLNDAEKKKGRGTDWKQFTSSDQDSSKTQEDQQNTCQQQNQSATPNYPWETLVLFGVNLSKLNIQMNMGNVMGNTTWLTRGFRSEGRVSIDSSGHKRFTVGLGLDGSVLDAKGGIVGGIIELSAIEMQLEVKEDRGKEPDHQVKLKLHTLQKRLDYMGTSVLMLRISDLDLTLRDEWRVDLKHGQQLSSTDAETHPTKRPALIFIHGNLVWDQLQILMSKSTTPDILKILAKLEEFFTQQFHSSKRVLSSLESSQPPFSRQSSLKKYSQQQQQQQQSGWSSSSSSGVSPGVSSSSSSSSRRYREQDVPSFLSESARHHRHWQKALRLVSGVHLSTLPCSLPSHGTILGGTVELTGSNISLACFYGINFRSKAWGLFSLKQPTISFAAESQDIMNFDSDTPDTHVIQNLSVSLGRHHRPSDGSTFSYAQHTTMATVCRMSRSVMFPPQFRHMHEWFAYAFATSDLDEVTRFPLMEFERSGDSMIIGSVATSTGATSSTSSSPASAAAASSNISSSSSSGVGSSESPFHGSLTSFATGSSGNIDLMSQPSKSSSGSQRRISASPKSQEFHHNKEIIFALPSFQMELKTEHLQAAKTPMTSNPKPLIDCTFVTDFDDHIFVAVDAEAYFFLHELITSYIKERDISYGKSTTQQPASPVSESKGHVASPSASGRSRDRGYDEPTTDWRDFVCHTWHLEPTVR